MLQLNKLLLLENYYGPTFLATKHKKRNNVMATWLWFHKFILRNAIALETTEWKPVSRIQRVQDF